MKIAMIQTPLTASTGGERQILRLAIELQRFGHEVEIFTNTVNEEGCYPDLLRKVTINVVPHPLKRFQSPIDRQRRALFAGAEGARTRARKFHGMYTSAFPRMLTIGRKIPKGFDIINNHNFPTEWAAFVAKKRLKMPVVWMCNEPPFWFFHQEQRRGMSKINWPLFEIFDKFAVKYIDEIVALSHIAEELIRKAYHRSSKIIRSGVDIEVFQNASGQEIREKYGLKDDFVLLQVGTLVYYKRQTDSIKTLFYLSKRYDNIKLIFEGVGDREPLRRLSKKLGIEDKIIFLVANDDRELAKIYSACDVFIFPSQLTWGLAVIEAMASSRPVIVSNKTGASEIVQNNMNGIIVGHKKPEEIAKNVELLVNNTKLRKKLGRNAHKYVKENLSWEKYAKSMERLFQRTISNFRRDS